jgi:hypothetical protein
MHCTCVLLILSIEAYRTRRTCGFRVTTSMGVSAMIEDLPWEGTGVTLCDLLAREESMSFQVVRQQTYETYRFAVGESFPNFSGQSLKARGG